MNPLTQALAQSDQPYAVFQALEVEVKKTIGVKLFTIMTLDHVKRVAKRLYTNMPKAYPTTGEKPIQPNAWGEQVIERQETFVANTIEEIANVFPDYALIHSLGCESCLNLPIVIAGQVIGTLNCLHEKDHYTKERVIAAEQLKPPGALALLVARTYSKGV